jgi:deoxyribonuclease-4
MRIGAHVSSAGGPANVFERVAAIGGEAVQLFISAPQQWRLPTLTAAQAEAFAAAREAAGIPAFFHGVYLMNFGSPDPGVQEKSVASLASYLSWADRLGVTGTVFHAGSHLGAGFEAALPQACRLIRQAMEAAPGKSLVILENNAGQGNCMGRSFAELGALIAGLDHDPRLAVCIDTCHAFAMGYDITTPGGCAAALDEFDREVGLSRLAAVHANDSKVPLGGIRDRHENIGEGYIGFDGFRAFMAALGNSCEAPFLLEVPGFARNGPDAENIDRLKRLRAEAGIAAPAGAPA